MNRFFAVVLGVVFHAGLLTAAGMEARFMRYPDIFKDKIVFTYEGDLWLVSAAGGTAARVTNAPGVESMARFSPDGKWIAFTASYDAPQQVYVMPSDGGAPKRLSYLPGPCQVVGWTPDSRRVVFRSFYENFIGRDPNLYFVDKNGSAPERFPIDRGRLCSFSPDSRKMVYQRKGDEEYYWKRYKGGWHTDIWMYDFDSKEFTPMTTYVGKNAYPMWVSDALYYVSDQANGISNLCRMDFQSRAITQVTKYANVDVMMPASDGASIVYVQDGYLHVFDPASATDRKLDVTVQTDGWAMRPRAINPKDYVHDFAVSNDGATTVFEARGDLFVVPADKGQTKNLSNAPGSREMFPRISPDGKTVAFFSDASGEYQMYTQPVGGGEWTQLTTGLDRAVYHLEWSPDGKKILFGNKDFRIFYIDLSTKKIVTVDESNQMKNDEFYWEISDYAWSPDSKWIGYSLVQYNRNSQIFLYSLELGKRFPVTNDFFDNINPRFDAGGDYLYFLSSRNFELHMDFYEDNHIIATPTQVMAVQLRQGERPPFADADKKEEGKKEKEKFRIDLEGLAQRTYPLPVDAGNYFYLQAGDGKVLWCSVDHFTENEYEEIFKPGGDNKWQLHIFDMKDKKEIVPSDKIRRYALSTNGGQLMVWKEGDYLVTTVDKAFQSKSFGDRINLGGMVYNVDSEREWKQIFTDAWRWYRDFFYSPIMNGQDWNAIRARYEAYLPQISSREALNWVLQQMVGELCVSHTYISGGDMGPQTAPSSLLFTGWLGADLAADQKSGYYRFERIYGPTEYNTDLKAPLVRPDIDVKEGDYLLAINGKAVRVPDDYWKELQVTAGQKVSITVNGTPHTEGSRTYDVEPIRNTQGLRYYRWLTENIRKVLAATDGKVGYMHINAMGSGGIGEFDKFWRAFRYKAGLLIDVRRNSGGWTEYFLVDKLERKMTAYNVLRNMVPFRYPGSTSNGQYVVITNEYNGSDGEAFVEDFKARKLGTVVGVPSWGGLVGILNGQTTIDNGRVEQSNNAFYGDNGQWLVENHGADPDVLIDNDPASVMAGKDLQLDKAIEVVLQKIKEHPFIFPPQPAYPKR